MWIDVVDKCTSATVKKDVMKKSGLRAAFLLGAGWGSFFR